MIDMDPVAKNNVKSQKQKTRPPLNEHASGAKKKKKILSLFPPEMANDFNLTLLVSTPTHIDGLSGPSKK